MRSPNVTFAFIVEILPRMNHRNLLDIASVSMWGVLALVLMIIFSDFVSVANIATAISYR